MDLYIKPYMYIAMCKASCFMHRGGVFLKSFPIGPHPCARCSPQTVDLHSLQPVLPLPACKTAACG